MIATTPDSKAVQVGPMDPDNTAELTARYGVANNSLELLKGQADNQPPELMAILAVPADSERSETLVHDEVVSAAGDLLTREGSKLLSSYVRGSTDGDRVVTISYQVPSGRTGKAALGLWRDFPQSVAAWESVRRTKMGIAAAAAGVSGAPGDVPPASPELEALQKTMLEQQAKIADLENPEPVVGYKALNARDAALAVYDMDASQVDATERYEANAGLGDNGAPRKTVTTAIEKRREDLKIEASDLAALKAARAAGKDPFAEPEQSSGEAGSES